MRSRSASEAAPDSYPFTRMGEVAAPDELLLERIAVGSPERRDSAFAALLARHGPGLRRVCRSLVGDGHDAEDLAQATFVVLLRKASTIRDGRSVASWMHGVARRLAVPMRAARARAGGLASAEFVPSREWESGTAAEAREIVPILRDEIDRLPDAYRGPVVLCCLEGRSSEEAAESLQVPVGTVKGRLHRARGMLRDRMGRRGVAIALALYLLLRPTRARASAEITLDSTARAAGVGSPRVRLCGAGALTLALAAWGTGVLTPGQVLRPFTSAFAFWTSAMCAPAAEPAPNDSSLRGRNERPIMKVVPPA